MILSGWVCAATKFFEFIQFTLQKFIQNKLQKLFNTNVIITFNKITKTKSLTKPDFLLLIKQEL